MASCTTTQWVASAPQVRLNVVETASTGATSTLTWTLYCITYSSDISTSKQYTVTINGVKVKEGTFNIGGVYGTQTMASGTVVIDKTTSEQAINFSCTMYWKLNYAGVYKASQTATGSISIAAKTSYTIYYDANGGTGAPSNQTKWAGEDVTLSSVIPTRTGYTFLGWGSSADDTEPTYSAGGTFSLDMSFMLFAVWEAITYTITFDANGGTDAPNAQTKTYDVTLVLTTEQPTRTDYIFVGWGVASTSTTAKYASGDEYTTNASITLYAIWIESYTEPYVMNMVVDRCDADGNLLDEGTYLRLSFDWTTDAPIQSIEARWSTSESFDTYESASIECDVGDVSGSVTNSVFGGSVSTESYYYVRVYVFDSKGSGYNQVGVASLAYTVDFLAGGQGAAFGKVASLIDTLDVNWNLIVAGKTELVDLDAYNVTATTVDANDVLAVNIESTNSNLTNAVVENLDATELEADTATINTLYDSYSLKIQNGLAAYASAGIDPDTTLEHLILTHLNTPNGTFMYIRTDFYASKSATSNRMQTAFPYNKKDGPYYRYYKDGEWSSWYSMDGITYSTTEQLTHDTWIDGKPIYRRVFTINTTTAGSNIVVGTISNLDTVVRYSGSPVNSSNNGSRPPTYYYSSSNYVMTWVTGEGNVYVRSSSGLSGYVVIEYTKTTD